jgi:hypothetical protein
MSYYGGRVCQTCDGKGRVYTARGLEGCPECRGAGREASIARAEARNALAECWARYREGETGDFNLEIAARRAIDAGWRLEAIAEALSIPREKLRRALAGQGQLADEYPSASRYVQWTDPENP